MSTMVKCVIVMSLWCGLSTAGRAQQVGPPEENQQLITRLRQTLSLHLDNVPFDQVMQQLEQSQAVSVEWDQAALTEIRMVPSRPVTLHVDQIMLQSALVLLVRQVGCTWTFQGGKLLITSRDNEETMLVWQRYPLKGLLTRVSNMEDMTDLLENAIDPESWADNGGDAEMVPQGTDLLVQQTNRNHLAISELLSHLRAALQGKMVDVDTPAAQRVKLALASRCRLTFDQVPLAEMADMLSRKCGIAVVLDVRSMKKAGIHPDDLVFMPPSENRLEYSLELMLERLDLVPIIHAEVLYITTTDASGLYHARVYSVAGTGFAGNDWDAATEMILLAVDPEEWTDFGGEASVTPFAGKYVIYHTHMGHREVEETLRLLRIARRQRRVSATLAE